MIAIGYCVIALIILFNYMREDWQIRSAKDHPPELIHRAKTDFEPQPGSIEQKLEHKRVINRELREMLTRLQTTDLAQTPSEDKPSYDLDKDLTLPRINKEAIENWPDENPFLPNKNPFSGQTTKSISAQKFSDSKKVLTTNPDIPFIIIGANSKVRHISNY